MVNYGRGGALNRAHLSYAKVSAVVNLRGAAIQVAAGQTLFWHLSWSLSRGFGSPHRRVRVGSSRSILFDVTEPTAYCVVVSRRYFRRAAVYQESVDIIPKILRRCAVCAPVIRCFGENSWCDIDFAVFYILPVPSSLTAKWNIPRTK